MKRRMGATGWVLLILGVILLTVLADVGRQWLLNVPPPPSAASLADEPINPAFKLGDVAPDFTLPDARDRPHRLSELVKGDTLLIFACGCNNCRELETYAGILMKRLGKRAPAVISVTTMPREQEAAWLRDTGLPKTFLYEPKRGPIMKQYAGHPCPRAYRLGPDRRVRWISPSLKTTHYLEKVGNSLAVCFGFPPEREVPGEPKPVVPGKQPG